MSVQKLEIVKKARKDQGKCSRCGDALPAGSAYQYWYPGFRSNYKIVRCMKAECFPRPSERETSKASTILAAQEKFADNIGTLDSVEDIEAAVQEVADAVEEVREEYESALDSWENGNEQLQEKVDHYESQTYDVDGWNWDGEGEPEKEDDESDEDFATRQDEWIEEVRQAARDIVESIETI